MPYDPIKHGHLPDSQPILHASIADLDINRVAQHIEFALNRRRLQKPMEPIEFLLAYHGLAYPNADTPNPSPTLAGILLFAHEPQKFLPYAVVDLGHFYGTQAVVSEVVHLEKSIGGNLIQQIDHIERYLWANTHHGFRFGDGAQRIDKDEYPALVLRELTVNALAHRDYARNQYMRVSLFRNRISWDNPGRLPDGVTIDTLINSQLPRNPAILEFLYQRGYVEGFGLGWDTVYAALHNEGLAKPDLQETEASFIVTVYGHPRTSFTDTPPSMISELSPIQQQIYRFIATKGSVSRADIDEFFPNRSWRSLHRDLQELIDIGLVHTIGATRSLRYQV